MTVRALLTGGTGFVGANLARRLLRDGHEVHLLVRPSHQPWRLESVRGDLQWHTAELTQREAVEEALRTARPDWVFHLAVHGAYPGQTATDAILATNVLGTATLADVCLGIGCEAFVNTGTSSEYGFKDHAPNEREWLEPNSYYAVTKTFGTQLCRYLGQHRDAPTCTLRLYSAYGPWEEPGRLIPALVLRGLEGRLPPLADPTVARDFVYIDDVVEAYLLAAAHAGQHRGAVYNVGTGTQTTLADAVDAARRVMGIADQPEWGTMAARRWDTGVWVADPSLIRAELGWAPRFDFEAGLRATVDWFTAHPEMPGVYHERSERSERSR